jgi:glycogen debranching enzyme
VDAAETPRTGAARANEAGSGEPLQFHTPVTRSLVARRPRTLKHGETFGVFNHLGDIVPGEGVPEGLYHGDTRHLSGFQFAINGQAPLLLSSAIRDDNAVLVADLTNPDLFEDGRLVLPRETIQVSRTKFLWQATCFERFAVRNFSDRTERVRLSLLVEGDFRDVFEVRGLQRSARGSHEARVVGEDTLELVYTGRDGLVRRTVVRFSPPPSGLDSRSAIYDLELAPRARASLFVTVSCDGGEGTVVPPQGFFRAIRHARHALRSAARRAAAVQTSNAIFNEVLCRSLADLCMLTTDHETGPYPYAGVPWFSTPFGRDGIVTAIEMLWMDPGIALGVLRFLASTQAKEVDPAADAEPGKILHEMRRGEMARLGEVPFRLYYGAVDTTPLFVVLAGLYYARTGDRDAIAALWPAIEAALGWIERWGDRDGDGFVEYFRTSREGLVNQGWKDSYDSVFHADGTLAAGPIALCEVQGYVYAAKRHGAALARALGLAAFAARLDQEAEALRERFESAFWSERLGTYVLALDGEKRPCEVRTSNAGQLLFTGIASPERARLVARQLLGTEFFCGWGIRTLSSTAARFNPMSYHNGSVWPHDNALIALGFARYGLTRQTERIFTGLFEAAAYMDLRRLPELFCGFRRVPGSGPTLYPVACLPQAWASAAPFALLQASLGLELDQPAGEIRFRYPHLPRFLDRVLIRSLRIGESVLDVEILRDGRNVTVNALRKEGELRVLVAL